MVFLLFSDKTVYFVLAPSVYVYGLAVLFFILFYSFWVEISLVVSRRDLNENRCLVISRGDLNSSSRCSFACQGLFSDATAHANYCQLKLTVLVGQKSST